MNSIEEGQRVAVMLADLATGGESEDLGLYLRQFGPDSREVLGLVIARLALGQERYGEWQALRESRDLGAERLEELADDLVYASMELLVRARRTSEARPKLAVVPRASDYERFEAAAGPCPLCEAGEECPFVHDEVQG